MHPSHGDTGHVFVISGSEVGGRIDQFLLRTGRFASRHQIQVLIQDGSVRVDERTVKPAYRLKAGERIAVTVPPPEPVESVPEAIPLDVVFEDPDLLVVDKPAGMVVHPAAGHRGGTLVNALLHHCRDLSGIGGHLRPGIVHRLDKQTSGLLVVAKGDEAHLALSRQFQKHTILREYVGLVRGTLREDSGRVDAPVGRHRTERKKMSTRSRRGRNAVTHWRVDRRFAGFDLVRFTLETGRTHQIRVHMAAIGHPIVGDHVYGGKKRGALEGVGDPRLRAALGTLDRFFLHAARLGFAHPRTGEPLEFHRPLPPELESVLRILGGDPT